MCFPFSFEMLILTIQRRLHLAIQRRLHLAVQLKVYLPLNFKPRLAVQLKMHPAFLVVFHCLAVVLHYNTHTHAHTPPHPRLPLPFKLIFFFIKPHPKSTKTKRVRGTKSGMRRIGCTSRSFSPRLLPSCKAFCPAKLSVATRFVRADRGNAVIRSHNASRVLCSGRIRVRALVRGGGVRGGGNKKRPRRKTLGIQ